ncbi:MAG TPA: hypothetical protein VI522_06785 [Gammaproteobacteria bacterium]|nr:hypothetical protein [Gammaproteobacteria bacterium]
MNPDELKAWLNDRLGATTKKLEFSHQYTGPAGVEILVAALPRYRMLSVLDLNSTSIDDKGLQTLAKALEKDTTLRSLDLGGHY